jgi:lambda family phage portal protein
MLNNDPIFVGTWSGSSPAVPRVAEYESARRWESAETSRLNAAHWQSVQVTTDINEDLVEDLQTLQRRCRYEAQNNSLIEGAIETHATDIGGDDGPSLQVRTDNPAFNEKIETLWADWVHHCEYQHDLSMVDLIHGWVGQLWYHGEFLCQDILGNYAMEYRLLDIGADRLDFASRMKGDVVMGVEVNKTGQPIAYWIKEDDYSGRSKPIAASLIHHGFRRRFAGQLRGIPILAGGLQPVADLRDYETQVMDAARSAADGATWLVTDHPDAKYVPLKPTDTWANMRRTARAAAPGWKPMSVSATQPAATHRNFKEDKERDIGLPAEMPLMILRHDSSKHNLSSARYDGVRYSRSISRVQKWFDRRILNSALNRLITLSRLDGTLRIDSPKQLKIRWSWPKPPSNDPFKEAMASRIRLENGTASLSEEIANTGGRPDQVIDQRRRDNEDLEANGLPKIIGEVPTNVQDYLLMLNDNQDQIDAAIGNSQPEETDDDGTQEIV